MFKARSFRTSAATYLGLPRIGPQTAPPHCTLPLVSPGSLFEQKNSTTAGDKVRLLQASRAFLGAGDQLLKFMKQRNLEQTHKADRVLFARAFWNSEML